MVSAKGEWHGGLNKQYLMWENKLFCLKRVHVYLETVQSDVHHVGDEQHIVNNNNNHQ